MIRRVLLTLVASASAECAWVLWGVQSGPGDLQTIG